MSKTLTVACGQIVCRPGDVEHNFQQIKALAETAAARGAVLMLSAEAALTGYRFDDTIKAIAPNRDSEIIKRLQALSARLNLVLVTGTVFHDGTHFRVSAIVTCPDGRLVIQHKHSLTQVELAHDIVPGQEERVLFEVDSVVCAISICADCAIENLRNKLAARGCQVYLAPTAGGGSRSNNLKPAELDDPAKLKSYLELMEKVCFMGDALVTCRSHQMALLACNLSGDDGVASFHAGHSSIIDSRGSMIGLIPGEYVGEFQRPQLICGDIVVQSPREVPVA